MPRLLVNVHVCSNQCRGGEQLKYLDARPVVHNRTFTAYSPTTRWATYYHYVSKILLGGQATTTRRTSVHNEPISMCEDCHNILGSCKPHVK